jgi:hypothetical protein
MHNEELHDQYTSSNIIWLIKSRWMRWVGLVAYIGKKEMCTGFWLGNLDERDHLVDLGVGGKMMSSWMLEK